MATESSFAALPVRQRGTLEIIDTALKLYRRYFGVLMGWSALVSVMFVLSSVTIIGPMLFYPFVIGACACCLAAAVRGQTITFAQVWEFTKPRYGALLLVTFLSILLMIVASTVISLVSTLLSVAGVWVLTSLGLPDIVSTWLGGIGLLISVIVGIVLSVLSYAWLGLVPVIACLEDDKRGAAAMGRAWELMRGSWVRVLGLALLLTIAILAVLGIVGGSVALFSEGLDAFSANPSTSALTALGFSIFGFFGLFFLFWNPIQTLVLAVLYLDLRVRNEALDLEWNSYTTAPPPETAAPQVAAQAVAPQAAPSALEASDQLASEPLNPQRSPAPATDYAPASNSSFAAGAPAPARPPTPASVGSSPASVGSSSASVGSSPASVGSSPASVGSSPMLENDSAAPESVTLTKAPGAAISSPQDAFDFSTSFGAGETVAPESQREDKSEDSDGSA